MHEHAEMYYYVPVVHDGMCGVCAGVATMNSGRYKSIIALRKFARSTYQNAAAFEICDDIEQFPAISDLFLAHYFNGEEQNKNDSKSVPLRQRSRSSQAKNEWVNEYGACMWELVLGTMTATREAKNKKTFSALQTHYERI